MKLNKHGWGLKEMIIMAAVLIVFLIAAFYCISLIYGNFSATEATVYIELENELAYAARDYVEDGHDSTFISLNTLMEEGYIASFDDFQLDPCDGYVIHDNGEYISYISCKKFKTRGYDQNNQ